MTGDRKTVYVNDKPIPIFLWAEVQHCVNAYDSDLFLAVERGEAEIVDQKGHRIGWGGFAGDGQHIYVRLLDQSGAPETFGVEATAESLTAVVMRLCDEGKIGNDSFINSLLQKLRNAQAALAEGKIGPALNILDAFLLEVEAQTGEQITSDAAAELIADTHRVITHL